MLYFLCGPYTMFLMPEQHNWFLTCDKDSMIKIDWIDFFISNSHLENIWDINLRKTMLFNKNPIMHAFKLCANCD